MKYATLLALVLVLFGRSFAQEEDLSKLAEVKDFGVTFNLMGLVNNVSLNSLSDANGNNALLIRKYLKEDMAVRFGFGLNSWNTNAIKADSVGSKWVKPPGIL